MDIKTDTGDIQGTKLKGKITITGEDVSKAAGGNYTGTTTFTIRYQKDGETAEALKEGRYTIDITLWHVTLSQLSMGNGAVVSPGVIMVGADGKMNLELTLQPLETSGLKGYLYNLKKVDMSTVEYNSVKYPVKYEAEDAEVLERFSGVYDDYNSPSSPSYD